MAGDWIKFEKTTLEKPEVFQMAAILSIDPDAVLGKLLRVWNWFDDQSHDGNASVTVTALLDRYAGVTGFVEAMKSVDWMIEKDGVITLPKFDRHNGSPAKSRALGKARTQKSRAGNAPSVTKPLQDRDESVTREEKRREEKSNTPTTTQDISEPSGNQMVFALAPPKFEDVSKFAKSQPFAISDDCIDAFWDEMEALQWTYKGIGCVAKTAWQARFRKYATNWINNRNNSPIRK